MIHTRAERLRTVRTSSRGSAVLHLVPTLVPDLQSPTSESSGPNLTSLDAAAALGLDPFKSEVRLWKEKTGRQDLLQPRQQHQQEDSMAYWSRLLEPIVAAHYTQRTGRQIRRIDAERRHPRHPWMVATVNREVVASTDVQLLECLCVGMNTAPLWAEGMPAYARLRVVHLLAVTGQRAADVVVLLGGQDLQIYRVERDEAEIARLIRAERAFWRGVELDRAPAAREGD